MLLAGQRVDDLLLGRLVHREQVDQLLEGVPPDLSLGLQHLAEQLLDPGMLLEQQIHHVGRAVVGSLGLGGHRWSPPFLARNSSIGCGPSVSSRYSVPNISRWSSMTCSLGGCSPPCSCSCIRSNRSWASRT